MKRSLIAATAVLGLAVGGLVVAGAPARASSPYYETEGVLRYSQLGTTWCPTADGSAVGDAVVLGRCASASTQEILLVPVTVTGYATAGYEWKFDSSGLCMTYPGSQGASDGVRAVQGRCVADQSQVFTVGGVDSAGDLFWDVAVEYDSSGHQLEVDDAGDVLKAYNPIDSSYARFNSAFEDTWPQQDFLGPFCVAVDESVEPWGCVAPDGGVYQP
jgi:hypothetical protein